MAEAPSTVTVDKNSLRTGQNDSSDEMSMRFLNAARKRDLSTFQEILQRKDPNFNINVTDLKDNGNGALHLLLAGCHTDKCVERVEKCLEFLLQNDADPNLENYDNKIPLDVAVQYMIPQRLAQLLVHYGASTLDKNQHLRDDLARKLAIKMPEIAVMILDKGVTFAPIENYKNSKEGQVIQLNWRHIVCTKDKVFDAHWVETKHLNELLRAKGRGSKMVFGHPLVKTFLNMKKLQYYFFFAPLYTIFTVGVFFWYMVFTWYLYNVDCVYIRPNETTTISPMTSTDQPIQDEDEGGCNITIGQTIQGYVIIALYCVPMWLEWRKMRVEGLSYFKRWQNYVFILATLSVILTVSPALSLKDNYNLTWEYAIAAVGMLIGPIFILIQMASIFPFIALYTEMLFKTFWRIVLATAVLSPLLLGFYFSLRVIMTDQHIWAFDMFTMIVGNSDKDFDDLKDSQRGVLYDIAVYFIFAAFVILLIVVLVNFLLGLAISDIQTLRESAKTTRLQNEVRSCYLSDVAYGNVFSFWGAITGSDGTKMTVNIAPLDRFRADDDTHAIFVPTKVRMQLLELARKSQCVHHTDENSNSDTQC